MLNKNILISALLAGIVNPLAFAMEPDPKEIQSKIQNLADSEPLWADKKSYISRLPKELCQELLNVRTNGQHHPAVNLFLIKHREKEDMLIESIGRPRRVVAAAVCDEKNNRFIVSYVINRSIEFFDLDTFRSQGTFNISGWVPTCMALDSKRNRLFVGDQDSSIKVFNINNDLVSNSVLLKTLRHTTRGINSFCIDTNNNFLYSSSGSNVEDKGEIKIWDLETLEAIGTISTSAVNALSLDEQKNRFFSGHHNGDIKIWDMTNQEKEMLTISGNKQEVTGLLFDETHNEILCIYDAKRMKKLNLTSFKFNEAYSSDYMMGYTRIAADNLLAVGSKREIAIIDQESGKVVTLLDSLFNDDGIRTITYCKSKNYIISTGINSNKIRIWQIIDPTMQKAVWENINFNKMHLFELAYELWTRNQNQKKGWFASESFLDLSKDAPLWQAFCQLPNEMQNTMRSLITIVEPKKENEPKEQEQKEMPSKIGFRR